MTNEELTMPRELLGRACVSNFLGTTWCADPEWFESKYHEIMLLGVENAIKLAAPRADVGGQENATPPYARVGNVAIIGIDGPIMKHPSSFGGASTVKLREALRMAAADESVKSIMMRISSPGGSADGVGDLGDDMRAIREQKPILVYAEDVMASGGYWVGAQASRIVASPYARIGSIGVYQRILDDSAAAEKAGVKLHVVRSTPKKAAGLPPVTEAHLKEVQKGVDATHEQFVQAIADGRRISLEAAAKWGTGEVWTAKEALEKGLIDEIGSIDHALKLAQSMAGEGKIGATVRRVFGGAEVAGSVSASEPGVLTEAAISEPGTTSEDFDKLLKGTTPSSEQATAPEPRPEDNDMTHESDAASVETDPATPSPPVAPPAEPQVKTSEVTINMDEYREMVSFVKTEKERQAKANASALQAARERVAAAHPHMAAESIAQLVREPGDADALIASLNGARASMPVDLMAGFAVKDEEGIPNVSAEIEKRRKERVA